jgi:HK97 gp10 family phage protein
MAGQARVSKIQVSAPGFEKRLKRAFDELAIESFDDLQRLAIDVQNRARQLCPVDTGRLRASIQHRPGRDARGPFVDVGTNVNYAAYVEYGTRFHRPQPFLRPAVAEAVAEYQSGGSSKKRAS